MGGMVLVREVTADEWKLMRDVRLTALRDAPYAFGSTYAREAAFTEEQWRGRFHDRAVALFAYDDSARDDLAGDGSTAAPAGLAGVYVKDGVADLVSMWVRPAARGLGVGEALVAAAGSWAKARSFETLFLWVTESNTPARRLYERCGFTPTGEHQPLPSDPTLREIRMSRAI
jgi:ribosomal protein S18 acetylase RimI-like enzyme